MLFSFNFFPCSVFIRFEHQRFLCSQLCLDALIFLAGVYFSQFPALIFQSLASLFNLLVLFFCTFFSFCFFLTLPPCFPLFPFTIPLTQFSLRPQSFQILFYFMLHISFNRFSISFVHSISSLLDCFFVFD